MSRVIEWEIERVWEWVRVRVTFFLNKPKLKPKPYWRMLFSRISQNTSLNNWFFQEFWLKHPNFSPKHFYFFSSFHFYYQPRIYQNHDLCQLFLDRPPNIQCCCDFPSYDFFSSSFNTFDKTYGFGCFWTLRLSLVLYPSALYSEPSRTIYYLPVGL